jgi:hypothetical protein
MKKYFESKVFKGKRYIKEEEELALNPVGEIAPVSPDAINLPSNEIVMAVFAKNMEANAQDQEKAIAVTSVELNISVEQVIDAVKDIQDIPHVDIVNDNDMDNTNVANVAAPVVVEVPVETVPVVVPVEGSYFDAVAESEFKFDIGNGKVLIIEKGEKIRILRESKYIIIDNSNNSGKDYIGDGWNNVSDAKDAKTFDSEKEAKDAIEEWGKKNNKDTSWASVAKQEDWI